MPNSINKINLLGAEQSNQYIYLLWECGLMNLEYAAGHSVWTTLEMQLLGRIVPGIEVPGSFKMASSFITFFKPALVG